MSATRTTDRDWTDPSCPVARAVDLVGDRWSLLIVRDAMDGATSFTDFHNRLGIARNILTERLRRLVERGILTMETAPGGRRHVYTLTETGKDLFATIVALRQWGERHAFEPGEPRSTLTDLDGNRVAELRPRGQSGDELGVGTSHVHRPAPPSR